MQSPRSGGHGSSLPRTFAGQLGGAVTQSGIVAIIVFRTAMPIAIFLLPWLAPAVPVISLLRARQGSGVALDEA